MLAALDAAAARADAIVCAYYVGANRLATEVDAATGSRRREAKRLQRAAYEAAVAAEVPMLVQATAAVARAAVDRHCAAADVVRAVGAAAARLASRIS